MSSSYGLFQLSLPPTKESIEIIILKERTTLGRWLYGMLSTHCTRWDILEGKTWWQPSKRIYYLGLVVV